MGITIEFCRQKNSRSLTKNRGNSSFMVCCFVQTPYFVDFIKHIIPLFYHSVNVPFYYTTLRHKKQWFFAVLLCLRVARVEL